MGDGLKLSKDKRHRSSSSISGVVVEGTRSERKLEIRGSIPEVDDRFALAEARCNELQSKIDIAKAIKKKKKLKKRSLTRVSELPGPPENVPLITVRTQPKKKVVQARLRRLQTASNPVRGYVDPEIVEQHRMLGQVHGYNQTYAQQQMNSQERIVDYSPLRPQGRRAQADGDTMYERSVHLSSNCNLLDMGTVTSDAEFSDHDVFDQHSDDFYAMPSKKSVEPSHQRRSSSPSRRRHVPKDVPVKEAGTKWTKAPAKGQEHWRLTTNAVQRRRQQKLHGQNTAAPPRGPVVEERPVVELFNKSGGNTSAPPRQPSNLDKRTRKVQESQRFNDDQTTGPLGDVAVESLKKKESRHPRKVKYRSRRYELPTVASQMKQAGVRYYYGNHNHTNIPFVVSKSTAPSHNIGVNIQQVLNGLKIQQPLSGIPPTLAHHMGLGHIPTFDTKSAIVGLSDNRAINAIKLGQRLVRLPSYKYISYNRMLNLYREGDGMVPRFLRAISRPHYFYTSMYNLATNREDLDGATSKGHGGSQEAKQSLAEYASLYREYEQLDKGLKEGTCPPEWARRRDELSRELAAREEHIRKVVQEYRTSTETEPANLRASASNAEDGYRRHSAYKINLAETQQ